MKFCKYQNAPILRSVPSFGVEPKEVDKTE